jgi:hypothetical protein
MQRDNVATQAANRPRRRTMGDGDRDGTEAEAQRTRRTVTDEHGIVLPVVVVHLALAQRGGQHLPYGVLERDLALRGQVVLALLVRRARCGIVALPLPLVREENEGGCEDDDDGTGGSAGTGTTVCSARCGEGEGKDESTSGLVGGRADSNNQLNNGWRMRELSMLCARTRESVAVT